MHAELKSEDIDIMASDGMPGTPHVEGNNVSLSINLDSESEQDEIFKKLSDGGKVTMPLNDTFWGARFGMLIDKFGIQWMLSVNKTQS